MDGNGFAESLQLLLVKILTGLGGIGLYFINRQELIGAVLRNFIERIPQQSTQAPTEAFV